MATYYGIKRREDGRGFGPVFNSQPRPRPSPAWTKDNPSPTAALNSRITSCATFGEVLDLFTTHRGDPAFDGANLCTCVSTCARRCRTDGATSAKACLQDVRWIELLELVGASLRELAPRGLVMVAWGLAVLKAQQPLMLKRLAWQVQRKLDQLDARMLANVTWAFATAGVRELDMSIAGAQLYPSIAECGILLIKDFKPQELANLLWSFATLGIRNASLFEVAAVVLAGMLEQLNAYDLGQTAWSFSTLRFRNDVLFDAIADRVKLGCDDHKPINVANLCWAYAKVEYSDGDLYRHLAGVAKRLMPHSNPQDLCNVLWALASTRVQDRQFCRMMSDKAIDLIRAPGQSGFTSTELASLTWSLAKLGESSEEHGELIALVIDELDRHGRARSIGQKDASMCLWALGHFGQADRAWQFFDGLVIGGVDPGVTSFSTVLAAVQRQHNLQRELRAWSSLQERISHPLLMAAVACTSALSCHRRRRDDEAVGILSGVSRRGSSFRAAVWNYLHGLYGGHADVMVASEEHPLVPPIMPKREGMLHAELYAKELEVLATVQSRVEPGSAESVIREIRRCCEEREAWLKLAGGEKTVVLERLVKERKPRLLVEVGFYVGYSSTMMGQHMRSWGGRIVSIEVDPIHVAIGQMSVALAGLADVVDVWVGHSSDVLPRLLDEFGPSCVDMVFFDQKGTIYHNDLATMEKLGLISDGCAVLADNVLKPGAPVFLWDLHYGPSWNLQIISLREYESEAIEDWISVASFDTSRHANGARPSPAPRRLETLAFETDAIRWRAMSDMLNVSDWVRHVQHLKEAMEQHGICPTATVEAGVLQGFMPLQQAQSPY